MAEQSRGRVPILLLKTKSVPMDTYEELFLGLDNGRYAPVFVPVLEHRFKRDALREVREHVTSRGLVPKSQQGLATYGALIFTSQRAVEAFTEVIQEIRSQETYRVDDLLPESLPLYVVGPATARGLRALGLKCPILGEETGNGEALAGFILQHYNALYTDTPNPPVLFMVGDKRRDIIPKTLQSAELEPNTRAKVDELVIYETGEMQSFKEDFSAIWKDNTKRGFERQWIVVFSPSGCQAMLESLDLLDAETGRAKASTEQRNILIATIGPTTRDYLIQQFGFTPDVCAEKPTPEGVAEGIKDFLEKPHLSATRFLTHNSSNMSSPAKSSDVAAGTKRKHDVEPSPKRETKAAKKQTTLEETMGSSKEKDEEMKDASDDGKNVKQTDKFEERVDEDLADASDEQALSNDDNAKPSDTEKQGGNDSNTQSKVHTTTRDEEENDSHNTTKESVADGEGAIEKSSQRAKQVPSNVLEKGVIYFFTRNRVGIEESESVGDLQRTFFVLRPMPVGAKLGDGPLADDNNNRLFALPKKVFPKSHNDRFMAFVEKANVTIKELKEEFFSAEEYNTKTQGTRRVEPVAPVAEGVYAITRTEDRTCHLVYSTTIPSKLGEVQDDLGIRNQGSFIISVKNPERSGPAQAQLPQKPSFPQEFIEEFRGLAWVEAKPKYLDYEYCQILLIGEKLESGVKPTTKDQKHDKETPLEEIEKLEHEDELRVEHLHGDDSVYDDLKITKKEYPQVSTTW
ncbi:tetrapyrrole biosynthesis, uroporphyrinogen III synthase [Bipolaris maydis]|uniref:tetrapyrrole biosynthesis, uroporphyrinogen III synthase n=1 Tax=Cochliobolus heterostrophus TaxID=5016 RepID=UPI0024DB6D90|nr:tetrapyrrole biosynthesis, uroporphyrinogen III synthase [Bipolaris maydis]KAJ6276078.1 tetrapyrrole biosynthesis, uroporphyrinogen III synthase [Bipolaris maydis]